MKDIPSLESRAVTFTDNYEKQFKDDWLESFRTQDKLYRQKKQQVKWYGSCNSEPSAPRIDFDIHRVVLYGAEWCLRKVDGGRMIKPPMYECERKIDHMPILDQHQFYLENERYVFLVTLLRYGWETDIIVEAMVE